MKSSGCCVSHSAIFMFVCNAWPLDEMEGLKIISGIAIHNQLRDHNLLKLISHYTIVLSTTPGIFLSWNQM